MKIYIGTKIVTATPMSRLDFEFLKTGRKPLLPQEATPEEDGYLVTYEDGYRSWSPQATFDRSYRQVTDNETLLLELHTKAVVAEAV